MSPKPGQSVGIGSQVKAGRMSRADKLARLPLWKQLAILAAWPLLEQLLAFAVGTTDTIIGGRFPDPAYRRATLDALGLGIYIMWLQNILQMAVATGGTALVSRASGSGDETLARSATQQTLLMGGVAGLVIGLAMWVFVPTIVGLFGIADPLTRQLAIEYLRWQAWVAPFSGVLLSINACRRGSGDTRTPFFVMLLVNGLNILFSWLLTFGPIGGHGISGLAIGTFGGWTIGAVVALIWLFLPGQELRPSRAGWRFERQLISRIVRVGGPSAIEVSGMWFFNAVLLWMIGRLPESDGLLGAHNIVMRCESMAFLPGFALAMAAGALCGQCLGRDDKDGAQRVLIMAWRTALVVMCAMGVLFFFRSEQLVALFAPGDARLLAVAAPILMLCGLQQPALASCIMLKSTFRSIGDAKTVMKYSYVSQTVIRVGGAWLLAIHFGLGLKGIWLAMIADVVVQAIIFGRRALSRKWMDVRV